METTRRSHYQEKNTENPPPGKTNHPHVAKNIARTRPARIPPKGPHRVMLYGISAFSIYLIPLFGGKNIPPYRPQTKKDPPETQRKSRKEKENTNTPQINPLTPVPGKINPRKTNSAS